MAGNSGAEVDLPKREIVAENNCTVPNLVATAAEADVRLRVSTTIVDILNIKTCLLAVAAVGDKTGPNIP